MISTEQLRKFKEIYKKEFNKELSNEEALEQATALYRLVEIIMDEYMKGKTESTK